MSIRLISNFRSLITLLLSSQTAPSPNIMSSMREVADEIGQDSNQLLQYLMKLVGNLMKTPSLTTLQHQLQNLRAEVDALIQDSQN